jgi:hypothetical protein
MPVISAATFAPKGDFSNQISAGGALLDQVLEFLKGLNVSLPDKDTFLKMVGEAYDVYVAPIDMPGIPNWIEPAVDRTLRGIILTQAGKIYDKFAAK